MLDSQITALMILSVLVLYMRTIAVSLESGSLACGMPFSTAKGPIAEDMFPQFPA